VTLVPDFFADSGQEHMKLIAQYQNGETRSVWDKIASLGQAAFDPREFPAIEAVLIETFERVASNLEIIHSELQGMDYVFFDRALQKPLPDVDKRLARLDRIVEPFGYVPLSLKYFYRIVGEVNFAWDYFKNEDFLWEMSDPLQIFGLDELLESVDNEYWRADMQEGLDDETFSAAFLELSADDYHKDNVSGGMAYSLEITRTPSIDSNFLFERHTTTFVDYLRICLQSCAFPGNPQDACYRDFALRVKPRLKAI
jgi:hypothetical protein